MCVQMHAYKGDSRWRVVMPWGSYRFRGQETQAGPESRPDMPPCDFLDVKVPKHLSQM
jgi:hypothetical protein